jgi:prophage antirepressor-like protein
MNDDLTFDGITFQVVAYKGQPAITLGQIAEALYGPEGGCQIDTPPDVTRVRKLYARHADEFSETMTGILKLQTTSGTQDVRVFSLRGAHLLGMLAHSKRAKGFRRWVLDVLDGRSEHANAIVGEYQKAVALLTAEKEVASWHGHGLNTWKRKKPGMESRAKRLHDELQLCLPLTFH